MTSEPKTRARPALGVAVTGVVMALLSLPLTGMFLVRLQSWNSATAACRECAPELFRQHLTEIIVIAVLPLLAVIVGVVALVPRGNRGWSRLSLSLASTAVLLGLACIAVLASTGIEPLQRQADDAAKTRQTPTAEETSRTPGQLRQDMEMLVRGSLSSLQPALGADDPRLSNPEKVVDTISVGECRLSNLASGRNYTFRFGLPAGEAAEEASRALEHNWIDQGYVRSGPSEGGDVLLNGNGKLPARYLTVNNDGDSGRLLVSIDSVCVLALN
ncbi:hypothetical protein [Arthrobacter roseus]|uniref:hypothetical protein n=1 Tax=Arthrobacter roseus TaxID=136274 RepID=UPI001962FA50|nr:hypothetical protein [Arthrobacter roseus]MBM7849721.1 hypothetical protein [Arthrobacter roseus]